MALCAFRDHVDKGFQDSDGGVFGLLLAELLDGAAAEGPGRADPHAGRLQAMVPTDMTKVALGHLPILGDLRRAKGACQLAAVTAYAEVPINENDAVFHSS